MNEFSFELQSARKDMAVVNPEMKRNSLVVEVFSAMAKGVNLPGDKNADKAVKYIQELASKASSGDTMAASELNQIRRIVIEPLVLEEARILELFGSYQNVGLDETVEREVWNPVNTTPRLQAANGDVPFGQIVSTKYTLTPVTISGGYAVDYRAISIGNMERENRGMDLVRTQIMNNAAAYVVKVVYNAVKNATGVKYFAEASGHTKANLDTVLKNVRRFGKTSIIGPYASVSQISSMVGWSDGASTPFQGISDAAMEEIRQNGLLLNYVGSPVREVPNPFDTYKLNAAGTNYVPLLPDGLLIVLPTGIKAPVATFTQGGLTTFTGNDVTTGKVITRFDLNVAADVAKGHEHEIGLLNDTSLSAAASYAV